MLNCDQVFEQLKAWAASQPNSIIDVQPTPTPEDTLVENVVDGYFVLAGLDFPQQSFVQGGRPYAYAKTDDDAYFWVLVDDAFEDLAAPWYQNGLSSKDAALIESMKRQADGESLDFTFSAPLLSQQLRVIRQLSDQLLYGEPENWEPSKPFTVLVRITSCRTLVPTEEAHIGWKTEAIALYRQGEGLSLLESGADVVQFFGREPASIPAYLSVGR